MTKEFEEGVKWLNDKVERQMLFGKPTDRVKQVDNTKLAKIVVGNTNKTAWVDTETKKAYKCGEYYAKTGMEITNFTFSRWCTSFDV